MKDEDAVPSLCLCVLMVDEQLRNVFVDQIVLQVSDVHLSVGVVCSLSNLNVL